jgi:hypothetical protein
MAILLGVGFWHPALHGFISSYLSRYRDLTGRHDRGTPRDEIISVSLISVGSDMFYISNTNNVWSRGSTLRVFVSGLITERFAGLPNLTSFSSAATADSSHTRHHADRAR